MGAVRLHGMEQGREDPRSGRADGMTEGHRAAVDVDLLGVQSKLTIDGQ